MDTQLCDPASQWRFNFTGILHSGSADGFDPSGHGSIPCVPSISFLARIQVITLGSDPGEGGAIPSRGTISSLTREGYAVGYLLTYTIRE